MIRGAQCFKGKIFNTGFPRNDILIKNRKVDADRIKLRLHLENKRCVLYAPTFRKDTGKTDFALDIERLVNALSKRFGGDWIVLQRSHYNMLLKNKVQSSGIIDVTSYPDMQELLLIADVLITDYSSAIWDYSFLYRPAFLYAPDLSMYYEERSFYVDIKKWPFTLAENNKELEDNILSYDQSICVDSIKRHHKLLGSYEKGDASKTVYELIKRLS